MKFVFFLKNYILLIMLLQLSQFFSLCPPPPSSPHSLRQSPHHCSCQWVMHVSCLATAFPMLYVTFPWLFCNCLFVLLNPLTSSPTHQHPLPSGNQQNPLRIHDSVSILICLVCFLDSVVDRYIFIVILLFIVLIFFFLDKSL